MSVDSRCVDALRTTSIEPTRAWRQPLKPVVTSRVGSGACRGERGCPEKELPPIIQYGTTLKPYSDCTASAGTAGVAFCVAKACPDCSLSKATTVSTRASTPCTKETAAAPSEWPMTATLVVRPGVTERASG